MSRGGCKQWELLEKLSSLAKIKLSEEEREAICRDLERTAEFLRAVGEAARGLETDPLYYPWDEWGPMREYIRERSVDVKELPASLKEGFIRVPWRAGRLEEG